MTQDGETLRQAVGGIPNASWVDSSGQLWTEQEIMSQWSDQQLDQPVIVDEDVNGNPVIRAREANGHPGQVLLSMSENEAGSEIPDEPVVRPENQGF